MNDQTIQIMRYLAQMGRASNLDIIEDLGVVQLDIDWALHNDRVIQMVDPPFGTTDPYWYDVRGTGETQCQ